VFVIDPAAHTVHAITLEAAENVPASHGEHALAPVSGPVLVTEPAAHLMHAFALVDPLLLTYVPASQLVQAVALTTCILASVVLSLVEYLPGSHGKQTRSDVDEGRTDSYFPARQVESAAHSSAESITTFRNCESLHTSFVGAAVGVVLGAADGAAVGLALVSLG
jgi:hypothetical protein